MSHDIITAGLANGDRHPPPIHGGPLIDINVGSEDPADGRSSGVKVLIVEDEEPLASLVRMSLEDHGFDVRVAGDGEQGLALFQAERPDIVVTDYMMPKMDGSTMVARLRASGETVPVIMASAVARPQIDSIAHADVDAFLPKPFRDSQLIALIRRQLAGGHASHA